MLKYFAKPSNSSLIISKHAAGLFDDLFFWLSCFIGLSMNLFRMFKLRDSSRGVISLVFVVRYVIVSIYRRDEIERCKLRRDSCDHFKNQLDEMCI